VLALLLAFFATALAAPVHVLTLKGGVDPGSADYLISGIQAANQAGAAAVVIELDTPGGLLQSARDIVSAELSSEVPVVVWVGPAGSRAGSAGVFLTLAASVAAMAPGTTIGAAHPVSLFGGSPGQEQPPSDQPDAQPSPEGGDPMSAKIMNDTLAWARAIANQRGRNAAWAESAVRESAAITDGEALANGVVDLSAADLPALLAALDGRVIDHGDSHLTLATRGAEILRVEMTLRQRIVHFLGDPNVLMALLGLGVLGLYIEFQSPGVVLPGAAGALCLLAAGIGLSILPFQVGGLLLVLGGFVAIGLELHYGGKGALAALGLIGIIGGGLVMFQVDGLDLRVDPLALGVFALVLVLVVLALGLAIGKAQRRAVLTGAEGMIGLQGVVLVGGSGAGRVRVQGEDWAAAWSGDLAAGEGVRVLRVDGHKLVVEAARPPSGGA